MKYVIYLFFLLQFLLFLPLDVAAQKYNITKYGLEQGLLSSDVKAIFQDSKGYIWISTLAGISRFDGQQFEHFTVKNGLPTTGFRAIKEDYQGNIWFDFEYRSTIPPYRSNRTSANNQGKLFQYDWRKFRTLEPDSVVNFGFGKLLFLNNKQDTLWVQMRDAAQEISKEMALEIAKHQAGQGTIYDLYVESPNHFFVGSFQGLSEYKDGEYVNHTKKTKGSTTIVLQIEKINGQYLLRTDEGIKFFDGTHFIQEGIHPELHRNITNDMLLDSENNVWFATIKGLFCYDWQQFKRFTTKDGLPSNRLTNLFIDKRDQLWMDTKKGFGMYNQRRFLAMDTTLSNGGYRSWWFKNREYIGDHEGNVWFNTNDGIAKFSNFAFLHYGKESGLQSDNINMVVKDSRGKLWFTYRNEGLSICDDEGNNCRHFTEEDSLLSNSPLSILEADNGDVWVSFSKGVMRYDAQKDTFLTVKIDPLLFMDSIPKEVRIVLNNPAGTIRDDIEALTNVGIGFLRQDKKGNIWMSAYMKGTVLRYDGKEFKAFRVGEKKEDNFYTNNDRISCFFVDSKDSIWAYKNEGLYKLRQDTFRLVGDSQHFGWVTDMAEDEDGNFWMVNGRGGLVRYDGKYAMRFDEMDGLNTNYIYSISILNGYAWLGSIRGIDKLDVRLFNNTKKIVVENIGKAEGFTPIVCTGLANVDRDDYLWFGSKEGVTRYIPDTHGCNDTNADGPILHITDVKLGFEPVDWILFADSLHPITKLPYNLRLSENDNTLTFDYQALTFSNPSKIEYQYFLKGFDKTWQPITPLRSVTYPNLPAGNYTFQVKACNENGIWSSEATNFSFCVQGSFWNASWFKITVIALALILIVLFALVLYFLVKKQRVVYLPKQVQYGQREGVVGN